MGSLFARPAEPKEDYDSCFDQDGFLKQPFVNALNCNGAASYCLPRWLLKAQAKIGHELDYPVLQDDLKDPFFEGAVRRLYCDVIEPEKNVKFSLITCIRVQPSSFSKQICFIRKLKEAFTEQSLLFDQTTFDPYLVLAFFTNWHDIHGIQYAQYVHRIFDPFSGNEFKQFEIQSSNPRLAVSLTEFKQFEIQSSNPRLAISLTFYERYTEKKFFRENHVFFVESSSACTPSFYPFDVSFNSHRYAASKYHFHEFVCEHKYDLNDLIYADPNQVVAIIHTRPIPNSSKHLRLWFAEKCMFVKQVGRFLVYVLQKTTGEFGEIIVWRDLQTFREYIFNQTFKTHCCMWSVDPLTLDVSWNNFGDHKAIFIFNDQHKQPLVEQMLRTLQQYLENIFPTVVVEMCKEYLLLRPIEYVQMVSV